MSKEMQLIINRSWIADCGSYGTGDVIVFDDDALTDEQYERLQELRDNDKFDYVNAILSGEPLEEWENN
jgi:hypothetical protein